MDLLESTIEELHRIDPFWDICCPCRCKGHCCVGADITIYENEWLRIQHYIETLPEEDKVVLRRNIARGTHCVFRAADKCLIHQVRPENCRYTPFQARIDEDDTVVYSMVKVNPLTKKCHFRLIRRRLDSSSALSSRQQKFLLLPNFDRMTYYLCLNWQIAQRPIQGDSRLASERMSCGTTQG